MSLRIGIGIGIVYNTHIGGGYVADENEDGLVYWARIVGDDPVTDHGIYYARIVSDTSPNTLGQSVAYTRIT